MIYLAEIHCQSCKISHKRVEGRIRKPHGSFHQVPGGQAAPCCRMFGTGSLRSGEQLKNVVSIVYVETVVAVVAVLVGV